MVTFRTRYSVSGNSPRSQRVRVEHDTSNKTARTAIVKVLADLHGKPAKEITLLKVEGGSTVWAQSAEADTPQAPTEPAESAGTPTT